MDRAFIVDGSNEFIRNYCVNPASNINGIPLGGVEGTLRSLLSFIKKFKPNMMIVVWDGERGPLKKRRIYPQYKEGRKIRTSGRNFEYGNEKEAIKNRNFQLKELKELISCLPILQIEVEDCEADDCIAYIVQNKSYFGFTSAIISSCDKDFYQLIDIPKKNIVFNPMTKELIDEKFVLEKYGVHPKHWLFYRCIDGDKSDNLNGVANFGIKTIQKLYPIENEKIGLNPELIKETWEAVSQIDRKLLKEEKKYFPKYEKLYNNLETIERNWKLMNLFDLQLSSHQINLITDNFANFKPIIRPKDLFLKMKELDGISLLDNFYIDFITLTK